MIELSTGVEDLTRVGKTTASRLKRLGLYTARDLLFHFPHRYEDWTQSAKIAELQPQQTISIQGRIKSIKNFTSPRKRMKLTEAYVEDETGNIKIMWFNQPFLLKNLPAGTEVVISGKAELSGRELYFKSPKYEIVSGQSNENDSDAGKILPIYGLSMNLTQKQVRFLVQHALPLAADLIDPLPNAIRDKLELPHISTAIRFIHEPASMEQVELAQKRFAFEEVFYLQLQSAYLKRMNQNVSAEPMTFFEEEVKEFVSKLPFELTNGQKKTAWSIFLDMKEAFPMNRLVQGDVGSGKTVVAAMAMYNVHLNKKQSVLLVPTEVLASQHFQGLSQLLSFTDINLAILTRSNSAISKGGKIDYLSKEALKEKLQSGEVDLAIGTHALIQSDVAFHDLALAVIDEQHRFGVDQRKTLREQSGISTTIPHLLSMTATPIPRTLSLVFYGDLAVSSIREMPKDRKPIQTNLVSDKDRHQAYEFIRKEIADGGQAYVVCPLIEESDSLGVTSVQEEKEKLEKLFPEFAIGTLHGKMKSSEKEEVMQAFKANKVQMLVATTVIEVGVDVPNATIMIIEGAERFGLAQLHQIRGRVGRGQKQSHCFLFPTDQSFGSFGRLQRFVQCIDGFQVAELDLEIRGGGEVLGKKQSGQLDFQFANISDTEFIEEVHNIAEQFLQEYALEDFPMLHQHIKRLNEGVHLE